MRIAVITGASSGMGREFVLALDRSEDLDAIWVIARRADRLEELRSLVRAELVVLPMDLTDRAALDAYSARLQAEKPEVARLVNAGGYGKFGAFCDLPIEEQCGMLDLNARALTEMTWRTLPYMKAGGQIYQVGSLSAFQPVPYIGVYGATKAYVLSFSRALGMELRPRGIRVLAVCPGWVKTDFFHRAVVDESVITYYNRFYTAEQVVRRAMKDMKRGRDVSVCGAMIRAQVRLTKLLPHRIVMRIWCRQQKKDTGWGTAQAVSEQGGKHE